MNIKKIAKILLDNLRVLPKDKRDIYLDEFIKYHWLTNQEMAWLMLYILKEWFNG